MSRKLPTNPEQFGQLPMFVQAKTLHNDYHHNDATVNGMDKDDLDYRKLNDVYESPLYDDIAENGVERPVNVRLEKTGHDLYKVNPPPYGDAPIGNTLTNGHHRVAAAYDINPNMEIPVNHTDRTFEGQGSGTSDWYDRSQPPRPRISVLAKGLFGTESSYPEGSS